MTDDACEWCGRPTITVIVTVNGWVQDACNACALALADPLFNPPIVVTPLRLEQCATKYT